MSGRLMAGEPSWWEATCGTCWPGEAPWPSVPRANCGSGRSRLHHERDRRPAIKQDFGQRLSDRRRPLDPAQVKRQQITGRRGVDNPEPVVRRDGRSLLADLTLLQRPAEPAQISALA